MGQRTQIVVKVKETNLFSNETKETTASYHNQWGIAKMQLMDAINLFNMYIDYDGFEFPKKLAKAWKLDESETCHDLTIQGVMDYLNAMDNNNGGLYIELNIENHNLTGGKMYIFNDPEAEENAVNRVISLAKYISYYPEYFDADFYTMFTACLRFHNIELVERIEQ